MVMPVISSPHKSVPKRLATRVHTWRFQSLRRHARRAKTATFSVRHLTLLQLVIRASTVRSKRQLREGHGLTLVELEEIDISKKGARSGGSVVRRRNRNEEGKVLNAERLNAEGLHGQQAQEG